MISFDYAQLRDVKIHYASAGQGEKLVILLHGFPEFWYSWRHQLLDLSDDYKVVAPDMRGYNLSEKPEGVSEYDSNKLADDVINLIDYLGYEKAAVVGHDWGASVAWAVALRNPEKVWKLACLQVPPLPIWKRNQTVKQFLASWYMFFFQLPNVPEWLLSRKDFTKLAVSLKTTTAQRGVFSDEDIATYKKAWGQPGALTAGVNYYRANILKRFFGGSQATKKINLPTLFIYGEKDHAILPETVEGVGDFVDGEYTELRIPDAAHWVQNEARDRVTEAIRAFLAKT